jgi:hypothetical protein
MAFFCMSGAYTKRQEHRELESAFFIYVLHTKNANYNLLDSCTPIHS